MRTLQVLQEECVSKVWKAFAGTEVWGTENGPCSAVIGADTAPPLLITI